MQVGTITVDGRQIGVVTFVEGSTPDAFTPDLGGCEHSGRDWQSDLGHLPHRSGAAPHRIAHGHDHRDHGHAAHLADRSHHPTGWHPVHGDQSLSGSEYLKSQRAHAAEELRDPDTRREVSGMLLTEGARDPVPVMEALLNRQAYTGKSIKSLLHSGFYGPINRGQLPGAMGTLDRNHELASRMHGAIDTALAGSNVIKGATDQGLPSDPNGRWMGGRTERGGNVFNDWGGGPGGHEGARRFREQQQHQVNAEKSATAEAKSADPEAVGP